MKGTRRWIGASDASSAAGACVPPGRCARPPLAGLCDTHVHVLDPQRFPFHAKRLYTPGPATVAQMQAMHARLGINRVVVVQNSVYGTDNRCLVDTLHQIGPQARGVCAMGPDTTKEDIDALDRAGVRGVRLNFSVHHTNDPTIILRALAVERHIPPHWHVHINADLAVLASIADRLGGMRAPVILDHFAHACAVKGVNQPGLSEIIALMQAKKAIVKLSGPYQISQRADYDDVQAIAQRFITAAPDQLIWGSDWPHTGGASRPVNQNPDVIEPFRAEDTAYNFALLALWVPDPGLRRQILVETPARLYGFAA